VTPRIRNTVVRVAVDILKSVATETAISNGPVEVPAGSHGSDAFDVDYSYSLEFDRSLKLTAENSRDMLSSDYEMEQIMMGGYGRRHGRRLNPAVTADGTVGSPAGAAGSRAGAAWPFDADGVDREHGRERREILAKPSLVSDEFAEPERSSAPTRRRIGGGRGFTRRSRQPSPARLSRLRRRADRDPSEAPVQPLSHDLRNLLRGRADVAAVQNPRCRLWAFHASSEEGNQKPDRLSVAAAPAATSASSPAAVLSCGCSAVDPAVDSAPHFSPRANETGATPSFR